MRRNELLAARITFTRRASYASRTAYKLWLHSTREDYLTVERVRGDLPGMTVRHGF